MLAKTADGARKFLIGGGAVYLVLWVIGLVGAEEWIPSNAASDWAHLAFGVVLLGLGVVARRV